MAAPLYNAAVAGATDAGGAWAYAISSGGSPRLTILHVLQDGTTGGAVTLDSIDQGMTNLAGTANSMTFVGSFDVGSPAAAIQHIWIGYKPDILTATVSGSNSTSEDLYIIAYHFTGYSGGTTLATVIENGTAGSTATGVGTGTTVSDTAVSTLGADRLALNLIGGNDDPTSFASAFTGQSGGTWVQRASFGSSSGTDGSVNLNTAAMAAAGTIDGGTYTVGASFAWGVVGFALIGTTVAEAFVARPIDVTLQSNTINTLW